MINKSINIMPINNKGQRHGYWEEYYFNGKLWYKCLYHNGKEVGYEESYNKIGKISKKIYHL